jgi:hypothetical protein
VTVCCFDPLSDGTVIYGPQFIFSYDPEAEPGQGWKAEAITLDPIKYPNDPRITDMRGQANTQACSTELRHLQGKRLMYTLPQMGGQYGLYAFEDVPSQIAYYAGSIGTSSAGGNSGGNNFAFHVDAKGGVWQGQTSNNKIWHYAFAGWSAAGIPIFASPVQYSVPDLFTELTRAHYESSSDTLYIGGYTATEIKKVWGEVGAVMSRYDHWTSGNPQLRWAVTLPLDDRGYPPKSFTIAGDYLFTVSSYPVQGIETVVTILDTNNGTTVGTLIPGAVVGNIGGWVDMIHGIQAMRRKNGQYLVIVEGDARGKNIVYQWTPA